MNNKKIKILFILVATLLLLGIVGFTIAYFNTNATFDNLFTSAIYQTTASETFTSPENWLPGDTTPKTVTVTNTGNIPVNVRVSYSEVWFGSNGDILSNELNGESVAIINLDNTSDWTKQGNYYYYNDVLEPNETTSSFIESVTFNPNATSDLTCITSGNTKTCTSSGEGYDNATYTLTIHIETIDASVADDVWDPDEGTLYAIIRDEYKSNTGYAGKYTDEHQDSFTRDATKDIYFYKTATRNNTTQGNNLLNKNNVIFAGFCWQMLRTTDTGGVKMIYNGIPLDGKCTNSTTRNTNGLIQGERISSVSMNGSYAYGSDFTYDLTTSTYKLSGTIRESINYANDKSVIGMYTCKNVDKNATCSTLYYLHENNPNNTNQPYVYPFTINSTNYAQIGTTPYNTQSDSIAYVGYKYNKIYNSMNVENRLIQNYSESPIIIARSLALSTTYWYADSINFGTTNYELVNPYQVNSTSDYPSLVGKYTFRNTSDTYTNSSVYYIVGVTENGMLYRTLTSGNISTYYYYGDSYDYGETVDGRYTLTNPTRWSNGVDVTGKYVRYRNDDTSVYYVIGMNGNRFFYELLAEGSILKYNDKMVFGDSIMDNLNGTYSLDNITQPISYQEYYNNYVNYDDKYTCGTSSTTCAQPRYIESNTAIAYTYINASKQVLLSKTRSGLTLTDTILVNLDELSKNKSNYSSYKYTCNTTSNICTDDTLRMIASFTVTGYSYAPNRYFGESATWNGNNYTLNNVLGVETTTNLTDLSTHHYTCIDSTGTTCNSVGYIYISDTWKFYYILLENGIETVRDALKEMLYEYNVNKLNTKDSAIKRLIEEWYYNNLLNYDSYLEEIIYCNDRSISTLSGWKDDGGSTRSNLYFKENVPVYLSCANETDKFSVLNSNAQLKYKVGLASLKEMSLINNNTATKTGVYYWLLSPERYGNELGYMSVIITNGDKGSASIKNTQGARPVISLQPYTYVSSGSGTMSNPYIIETN